MAYDKKQLVRKGEVSGARSVVDTGGEPGRVRGMGKEYIGRA